MGQVWLGRLQGARGFSKLVAVKTLLPAEQDLPRLEAMLAEEARLASLIQHANVVHTLELGEHDGLLYLVMEWVDGEPLGFLLKRAGERGGLPLPVAVALVSQVLSGLHAVHELGDASGPLGVVHRDVSPHNILVTYEGVAKLLDFGIAKATQQQQVSQNTETGEIKGKFSYMAPEQILGGEVDRRCDVFATGIVLYLLATGRHPFKHHNTAAVIHAITTDEPVAPPSTLVEDFPVELERVLLKALEKNRENRWSSAEDMRAALEQALPEAFGDVARVQLREFMDRCVGDRKLARREAVRRAQARADELDLGSGTRKALEAGSAQSAASLRAMSISTSDAPEQLAAAPSAPIEEPAPIAVAQPKPRRLAPWLTAAAGGVLAIVIMLPRLLAPHGAATPASAGVQAGASLTVEAVKAASPAAVKPPEAAPADVPAVSAPLPEASIAPPTPPHDAPPLKAKRSANANANATKKASVKSSPNGSSDLLTPDYAR